MIILYFKSHNTQNHCFSSKIRCRFHFLAHFFKLDHMIIPQILPEISHYFCAFPHTFILIFCQNFLTTVAILLEAGSYVNAQTLGGETALMKVMLHFTQKLV